jgi:hypothetical protein
MRIYGIRHRSAVPDAEVLYQPMFFTIRAGLAGHNIL